MKSRKEIILPGKPWLSGTKSYHLICPEVKLLDEVVFIINWYWDGQCVKLYFLFYCIVFVFHDVHEDITTFFSKFRQIIQYLRKDEVRKHYSGTRKSSCGKPQEAYHLLRNKHSLFCLGTCLGRGGVPPVLYWPGYSPGQDRCIPSGEGLWTRDHGPVSKGTYPLWTDKRTENITPRRILHMRAVNMVEDHVPSGMQYFLSCAPITETRQHTPTLFGGLTGVAIAHLSQFQTWKASVVMKRKIEKHYGGTRWGIKMPAWQFCLHTTLFTI